MLCARTADPLTMIAHEATDAIDSALLMTYCMPNVYQTLMHSRFRET